MLSSVENGHKIVLNIRECKIPVRGIDFDQIQRKDCRPTREIDKVSALIPPVRVGFMCPEVLIGNGVKEISKAIEHER